MTKRRPTGKTKSKTTTKKPTATTSAIVDTTADVDEAVAETADTSVMAAETSAPATTAARRPRRLTREQVKTQALEVEYAYVVKDLNRVFILAAIMVVGLIAANVAFRFLGG